MEYFVKEGSIVRQIWGRPDSVLFIFAGAAAEFALNKAVDWLYFTGRLPTDPLGRLFSTVTYARLIIFSPLEEANKHIDQITQIHQAVEQNRNAKIPDWAYRDVLFMLIWYSIRSYEVLYRPLSQHEKTEVFDVFYRVGERMGIAGLPQTYNQWKVAHKAHINNDTVKSGFTTNLYQQYLKHLGRAKFYLLQKVQALIVPRQVRDMLDLGSPGLLYPLLIIFKFCRLLGLSRFFTIRLLPAQYKGQLQSISLSHR